MPPVPSTTAQRDERHRTSRGTTLVGPHRSRSDSARDPLMYAVTGVPGPAQADERSAFSFQLSAILLRTQHSALSTRRRSPVRLPGEFGLAARAGRTLQRQASTIPGSLRTERLTTPVRRLLYISNQAP